MNGFTIVDRNPFIFENLGPITSCTNIPLHIYKYYNNSHKNLTIENLTKTLPKYLSLIHPQKMSFSQKMTVNGSTLLIILNRF